MRYILEDMSKLIKKYPYLQDTAKEMIEGAIYNGYYEDEVIDEKFIHNYLLEELNSGFIKIK